MKEITATELQEKINRKDNFQLIDVREDFEYDLVNIGGELIPTGQIFEEHERISRDKDVILHCKSGRRSSVIIGELERRHGFTNLYNLKGGILAYIQEVDPSLPSY
jgi:rhodanese-related sulfurtransferase